MKAIILRMDESDSLSIMIDTLKKKLNCPKTKICKDALRRYAEVNLTRKELDDLFKKQQEIIKRINNIN